ncbi:MAG: alpha/beta hydrolase [Clostridiales bacterium]|nr:alpha/beta hydrolase [Clostridiales bacterium]
MRFLDINPLPGRNARLTGYIHEDADQGQWNDSRPCVLILPGGGYQFLAPHEAEPVAMQFYVKGYQTFILYYSVSDLNTQEQTPLGLTPLCDASAAVQHIRENSADWRVDARKIAVLGFSAGGHLAASLGVFWNALELNKIWDTENGQNRPDALILCYPVITAGKFSHRGSIDVLAGIEGDRSFYSLEKHVGRHTPPAFLWQTVDDAAVPVENALLFISALRKNGVPFECHLYDKGEHGISLANGEAGRNDPHCATWLNLCVEWLERQFGIYADRA